MELIHAFEQECQAFPAQYTPEWFAKQDCIGGSEFHYVVDASCVEDCYPLVVKKLLANKDRADLIEGGNPKEAPMQSASRIPTASAYDMSKDPATIMGWGTLFEPALCSVIEQRIGAPIECRSTCVFKNNMRYSPDGVFLDPSANGAPTILEMKNPFMYVWKGWDADHNDLFTPAPDTVLGERYANGTYNACVKPDYIQQMQAGLYMLPFTQSALFVEAIMRRAAWCGNGITKPRALGIQKTNMVQNATPLATGIIAFYHADYENADAQTHAPYDFRNIKYDHILADALAHQRDGTNTFSVFYGPWRNLAKDENHEYETESILRELPREHDGKPLFGYMQWLMLGIHAVRVKRKQLFDQTMQSTYRPIIDTIADLVRAGDALPTIEQKREFILDLATKASAKGCPAAVEMMRMLQTATAVPIPAAKVDAATASSDAIVMLDD